MMWHDVQAVVFDVFGTVVDWRSGITREVTPFLHKHGYTHIDPQALADAWRRQYSPSMEAVRSGLRPFVRLDVLHRENIEIALHELGVQVSTINPVELDALTLAWHRLDPWPDVCEGLQRLKARFIIAPLSNGNIRLMLDVAKHAALPWDAILGAEVVQAYKPMPETYLRTADVLGLSPEQMCLVAAHNSDLAAARRCGFRTVFVPRPSEHGPHQTTDLVPSQEWDATVSDFGELADCLLSHITYGRI